MTDTERRALISYYARAMSDLNKESTLGYGLMKKETIVVFLERALELAQALEGNSP